MGDVSMTQFVTARQQAQGDSRKDDKKSANNAKAHKRIDVGHAEEAVSKTVDHVEERIQPRHFAPYWRQRMGGVNHARQESQRHDQKVLECCELVEFIGPYASDQSERS